MFQTRSRLQQQLHLRLALRLHPYAPGYFETDLGLSLYMQRRYQDVVTHFSQSGRAFSESPAPHAILAASYAQLGRGTEASAAVRRVKSIYPFFNSGRFALNNVGEEAAPLLLEGLHKAGLD